MKRQNRHFLADFKDKKTRDRNQLLWLPPGQPLHCAPAPAFAARRLEDTVNPPVPTASCLEQASLLQPLGRWEYWPQCLNCHLSLLPLLDPFILGPCISLRSLSPEPKRFFKGKVYFQQWTLSSFHSLSGLTSVRANWLRSSLHMHYSTGAHGTSVR